MPFAMEIRKNAQTLGEAAFEKKLGFDEMETISNNMEDLCNTLALMTINSVDR